jgi:crotonobetainyl-CoA:carnitine CoA-transferase CaiB-like acyl-CoA transferase
MSAPPLTDLLVADFSRVLAGPFCTMTLGDLGAEVIKVERPTGDDTRAWGPPFLAEQSSYYLAVNRNKQSVVLDLRDPADLEAARELAARADVLIENFRPGTMGRLGLGEHLLRERNPGLIYCSISAFGPGAGRDLPGYDLPVQALGGLMSITGSSESEPTKVGVALVDVLAGLFATVGILAALRERERSGEGQRVEINLLSALLSALANQAAAYVLAGEIPRAIGNGHPSIAPHETFATKDGTLAIAVGTDRQFAELCAALDVPGLASDARFHSNERRVAHRQQLKAILEPQLAHGSTEQWTQALSAADVPAGPVNDLRDAFALAERLGLRPIRQAENDTSPLGRQIASPIALSATPIAYRARAPQLGEQTDEIKRWLRPAPRAPTTASAGAR